MARGEIKQFAKATFVAFSDKRLSGEIDNRTFRITVCNKIVENFPGMSLVSAGTHYTNILRALEDEKSPLVVGLGRAPEKRGGRPHGRKTAQFKVRRTADREIIATGLKYVDAVDLIVAADAQKAEKLELVR